MKKVMTRKEYDQCMLDYERKVHNLAVPIARDIFIRNAPQQNSWDERYPEMTNLAGNSYEDALAYVSIIDSYSIRVSLIKQNEGEIHYTDLGEPFIVQGCDYDNKDGVCKSCLLVDRSVALHIANPYCCDVMCNNFFPKKINPKEL